MVKNINNSRNGLIDGLPNSYSTSYVLKTNKTCKICQQLLSQDDVDNNEILCSEDYDFYHKTCLDNKGIKYKHQKENDKSSMARLISTENL